MGTRIYDATGDEIVHFSRIHREGVLLLPESVGPLWAGTWLDIRAEWTRLTFRVARRSRVVRIVDLAGEDITAAGFPAVRPGVLYRWWIGLPHGWDSRATAVWVWGGQPKPFPGNGVFTRRNLLTNSSG